MTITELPIGTRPHVTVLADRCAGCQDCIVRCPTGALDLDPDAWIAVADDDLCVGCQQCTRVCAFSAITVSGRPDVAPRIDLPARVPERIVGDRCESRPGISSWTDARFEAARCLDCPDPTCVRGCPAHNDIPAFVSAVGAGNLEAAHAVLRRTSVLPDICARVCDQAVQCEGACTWSLAGGEPVAIGALERFITDQAPVPPVAVARPIDLRVAVVGSGPAGLAAAWALVEGGAAVTVFDQDREPGGLLRWGIPDFTLPSEVAERPVLALRRAGVEFRLGEGVDDDRLDALLATYDAVVWAVGAGVPITPPIPGADLDGVWTATRFLTRAHDALAAGAGDMAAIGAAPRHGGSPHVVVLGAGNTAMDVARSARRLGAEVLCVDWMDRRFAPVRPDELAEAEAEGVVIRFSATVAHIEGRDGRVVAVGLRSTRQRDAASTPSVTGGHAVRIGTDLVVMAMGYRIDPHTARRNPGVPVAKTAPEYPDRTWIASGLLAQPSPAWARHQPVGRLALGRETARRVAAEPTSTRLWCVGDARIGPATVVEAMAHGREAALAILAATPTG
jgi:glutamate synthase (NADPH/NADH) small chain